MEQSGIIPGFHAEKGSPILATIKSSRMQSLLLSGISLAARSHPKDDRSPIAQYRIVVFSLASHWHWQLVFASFLPRTVHAWFLVWSCEGSLPACGLPVF